VSLCLSSSHPSLSLSLYLFAASVALRLRTGSADPEYLSLGVDHLALFSGRTPLEIYSDCIFVT
jgi:hypothetical protein